MAHLPAKDGLMKARWNIEVPTLMKSTADACREQVLPAPGRERAPSHLPVARSQPSQRNTMNTSPKEPRYRCRIRFSRSTPHRALKYGPANPLKNRVRSRLDLNPEDFCPSLDHNQECELIFPCFLCPRPNNTEPCFHQARSDLVDSRP